ncbi:TraR/DksA C4-type zinc finger protein [Salinibacterium sp. ZJ70]|uniref:TraR/DksA C4-type zinc finger protein n=1 Tax=Salinibacterium sp. ZJ70 TaxID=2708084 RepID=UPI00142294C3|nr:TraR/DksA C4-type zinc finger protein [Salinibacterium sp. ZJ70]
MTPEPQAALGWIAARRARVEERLASVEGRLVSVREARSEWSDEEHDPEGFALTFEWQQAEGAAREHRQELVELDQAAARVREGRYGICTVCGNPIPDAQLERTPTRTTCVAHAAARR